MQDPHPLRISGFRQAALASAAHDHARVWLALRQAGCGHNAPLEQLVAAVEAVPAGEFNFPLAEYTHDEALLVLLASSTRQHLEVHLEPYRLAQWYADAQAEAVATGRSPGLAGSSAAVAVAEAAAAAVAEVGPSAAAGTSAPLRKDNTSSFVGVSRIAGSQQMAAGITGAYTPASGGAAGLVHARPAAASLAASSRHARCYPTGHVWCHFPPSASEPTLPCSCPAVAGKRVHLGAYATAVQAAVARDVGIIWKRLHGALMQGGGLCRLSSHSQGRYRGCLHCAGMAACCQAKAALVLNLPHPPLTPTQTWQVARRSTSQTPAWTATPAWWSRWDGWLRCAVQYAWQACPAGLKVCFCRAAPMRRSPKAQPSCTCLLRNNRDLPPTWSLSRTNPRQLRDAEEVVDLKAVLEAWAPDNLADVADIVEGGQQGGGTRAASEWRAPTIQACGFAAGAWECMQWLQSGLHGSCPEPACAMAAVEPAYATAGWPVNPHQCVLATLSLCSCRAGARGAGGASGGRARGR